GRRSVDGFGRLRGRRVVGLSCRCVGECAPGVTRADGRVRGLTRNASFDHRGDLRRIAHRVVEVVLFAAIFEGVEVARVQRAAVVRNADVAADGDLVTLGFAAHQRAHAFTRGAVVAGPARGAEARVLVDALAVFARASTVASFGIAADPAV